MGKSLVKLDVQTPTLQPVGSKASEMIAVEDKDSYEFAVTVASEMKCRYKEIDAKRVELKAPILAAGRAIDGFFKPYLDFYASEETAIKGKLTSYISAVREQERAHQRELDRVAREEQESLAKKAERAEQSGDSERAEALRAQAAVTGPADASKESMKVAGGHTRSEWSVELRSLEDFLRYALANPAYLKHVEVNLGTLKRLISAGGTIPDGVKAEQIEIPVISTI